MNTDLAEFIEYSFGSVWALELLLLLHDSKRGWLTPELVRELRSSDSVVEQSIERLVAAGLVLVEKDAKARYAPATSQQDVLVKRLHEEYMKRPAAVRRVILHGREEKLRSFSDAFMLKRDGGS